MNIHNRQMRLAGGRDLQVSQPDLRVDASSARIKREVDAGQVDLHELHMGRANQNCTGSQSSAHYARL